MSSTKKLHKFIFVDPELCTGCEMCESVCSFVHDGEFNPLNSRIHRVRIEPIVNIALACQKCETADCIRVCMENAIDKDAEGSIVIDEDRCTGCGFCIRACPFGVITMHLESKCAIACDLCENMKDEFIDPEVGKKEPQCIVWCPKEAISLKTVEQIGEESRTAAVRRLLAEMLD